MPRRQWRITVNHQFSVVIDIQPKNPDQMLEIADALGNAKCLDASVGGHDQGVEAVFDREAGSLDVAIKSAVSAVESAGFRVIRVEMDCDAITL